MAVRNLDEEQKAGIRLSRDPGSPFHGKNFADPIVKKSYFEAINKEVYGIPNPTFGEGAITPSPVSGGVPTVSPSTTGPPAGGQPMGGGFVTEEQFGVPGAETAYKKAKAQFSRMSLGAGTYAEQQKKTYEEHYPEIKTFQRQEGEKYEELGNMRNELELYYEKAGIVDPQVKNALIAKRMNEVRKDIFNIQSLKQQRGLTIQDLTNKAITAYGLSIDAAQAAAEMAKEDYMMAFDKYAQELSRQESDRDRLFKLAFDPGTLAGGVVPEALFGYNPELRGAWERMSDVARPEYLADKSWEDEQRDMERRMFEYDINRPYFKGGVGKEPDDLMEQFEEDFNQGMSYEDANEYYPEFASPNSTVIDEAYNRGEYVKGGVKTSGVDALRKSLGMEGQTISTAPPKQNWWQKVVGSNIVGKIPFVK